MLYISLMAEHQSNTHSHFIYFRQFIPKYPLKQSSVIAHENPLKHITMRLKPGHCRPGPHSLFVFNPLPGLSALPRYE